MNRPFPTPGSTASDTSTRCWLGSGRLWPCCVTCTAWPEDGAGAAVIEAAIDGKAVYDGLCFACHTSGVGNAPTLDHSHWDKRLAQGKDTLYKHAIEGFNGSKGAMPPKGGSPSLSDDEIKEVVNFMVAKAQ